jgi:hypothetical protein
MRHLDGGAAASALACLEPRVLLVNHVNPALAANDAAILVTTLQRFKRIPDFHWLYPRRAAFQGRIRGADK